MKFDGEICGGVSVGNASDDSPKQKKLENYFSPSKLRRKFATNFAENFANLALEIAGPEVLGAPFQWNPKYGCKGTVTTRFALIALVAWQY